jgi:gamma-aminobutyric acid type B receptor
MFANGKSTPPELLRDTPDQNYLSEGLQTFGFILYGVGVLIVVLAVGWTYWNRAHLLIRSSQPVFLYMLCFGCLISLSTIVVITLDESDGLSSVQLDHLCMAVPWLISMGHSLTFGSLFMKLWRVNMVLSSTRRSVTVPRVMWPMAIMLTLLTIQLILWTVIDPLQYVRTEIDAETGESIGQCESEHMMGWVLPMIVQLIVPSILTCYMAFRTIDVDESFSEAKWIFIMIVVQLEAVLMAIPVLILLRDVNSDGHYVSVVTLVWAFPVSSLLFLFVPKAIAHRESILGHEGGSKRGSNVSSGIKVTGVSIPSAVGTSGGPFPSSCELGVSAPSWGDGGHQTSVSEVER